MIGRHNLEWDDGMDGMDGVWGVGRRDGSLGLGMDGSVVVRRHGMGGSWGMGGRGPYHLTTMHLGAAGRIRSSGNCVIRPHGHHGGGG